MHKFRFPLFLGGISLAASLLFWAFSLRPHSWIEGGKVAARSSTIASDCEGKVAEIGVREGEKVEKGHPLFALDTALFDFAIEKLRGVQKELEEQLLSEERDAQETMQEYLGAIQREELGLEGEGAAQRLFSLLEEGQKKAKAAERERKNLETEEKLKVLERERRRFSAPFDAVVARRWIEEGSVVSFGQPAFSLYDPSSFWVEVPLEERHLSSVFLGARVQIELEAFPKKRWEGEIVSIAPGEAGGAPLLRVRPLEKELPWLPGLSAKVRLKR